jgi:hypothetical protein
MTRYVTKPACGYTSGSEANHQLKLADTAETTMEMNDAGAASSLNAKKPHHA